MKERQQLPKKLEPPPIAGKVPPHDLDAEAATISASLLDSDALDRVLEIMAPEHCYSEANARILQAAQQLRLAATTVDMVSVASWLRDREWLGKIGGTAYLAQLADAAPHIGNIETYARTVHEKWRLRQLIKTCQLVSAEGYGDVGGVDDFITASAASVVAIAEGNSGDKGPENATIIAKRVREGIAAAFHETPESRAEKTMTGMSDLDRLMGPLKPSLTIIAAWSGVGKTSLAREWAIRKIRSDKRKRGVIIFSFEMTRDEMIEAMAYSLAGVDSAKLDAHEKLTVEEAEDLAGALAWLEKVPWLWIVDQETMKGRTPAHIEAMVRRIQRGEAKKIGVDVAEVFVDYLQLVSPTDEKAPRVQQVDSIAYGLLGAALRLRVPVIALSQLNEDGKKRKDERPCAEDTRESKGIVQAAHRIILIYNPHYIERRRKMQEERGSYRAPDSEDVELIVDKNRGGRTGVVQVQFLPWCTRFQDMPVPNPG